MKDLLILKEDKRVIFNKYNPFHMEALNRIAEDLIPPVLSDDLDTDIGVAIAGIYDGMSAQGIWMYHDTIVNSFDVIWELFNKRFVINLTETETEDDDQPSNAASDQA